MKTKLNMSIMLNDPHTAAIIGKYLEKHGAVIKTHYKDYSNNYKRLNKIILFLRKYGKLTTKQISKLMSVSHKTTYRDLLKLLIKNEVKVRNSKKGGNRNYYSLNI